MGKGKHNEWRKTLIHSQYADDNKQIRKRIKNKINKEINVILQERK